jgi:HD-GYP domain-containing protein (c-di-GMP phosphodiesterase class II)
MAQDIALSPRLAQLDTFVSRLAGELRALGAPSLTTTGGAQFAFTVYQPHPLLIMVTRQSAAVLFVPADVWERVPRLLASFEARVHEGTLLIVLMGSQSSRDLRAAMRRGILSILPSEPSGMDAALAAVRGLELLESRGHAESRGRSVERYRSEMGELVEIARAMTTERNVDSLLNVILQKSRFVTTADAGSIYVVEADDKGTTRLRFKLTQNDSVQFDWREFTMPISTRSIAGAAALDKQAINIADVYDLPAGSSFGFDRSFDQRVGYRTKSMLTMPLISQRDEVIGIIQLINRKTTSDRLLTTDEDVLTHVVPFDFRSEELLRTVAAQAAISLENALLYEEIRQLFDGFVRASVEAIEARDPTTSGHSRRVADLTVALARVVHDESTGPYREARFNAEDMRELEYASLLHDFGKIGVREHVLVKAKKLYDERLELLRARFDYVERSLEADILRRKLQAFERGGKATELEALDREMFERRAALAAAFETILSANEPTVLAAGDFARIEELARETFFDARGEVRPLLDEQDVVALTIKRGSLTPAEYEEITSHVTHTFKFLSRIPWGKQFRRVPQIAGAHHERVNGTGYPNRLRGEEIPVQSKLMSISDIFDALTASDRPYKKAVPLERALDILEFNVKDGHLDGELVRIFREARVWSHSPGTV